MGSYFRPKRRMLGVITLLVACAFTAAWIRSVRIGDMFACGTGQHWVNYLGSTSGVLFVGECGERANPSLKPFKWFQFPASMKFFQERLIGKTWYWRGFGLYETIFDPQKNPIVGYPNVHINTIERYVTIPYWATVTPLTLLSAYLLLSPVGQAMPSSYHTSMDQKD